MICCPWRQRQRRRRRRRPHRHHPFTSFAQLFATSDHQQQHSTEEPWTTASSGNSQCWTTSATSHGDMPFAWWTWTSSPPVVLGFAVLSASSAAAMASAAETGTAAMVMVSAAADGTTTTNTTTAAATPPGAGGAELMVMSTTTEEYVVLPGPEDVTINYHSPNGLYQQSVTLTARMWPPIEAGSPKIVWGLPVVVWCILLGCLLLVVLILLALLLCFWLVPRRRKLLSPTRFGRNGSSGGVGIGAAVNPEVTMAQRSSVVAKSWKDSNYMVGNHKTAVGQLLQPHPLVPPQYSAPPPPPHSISAYHCAALANSPTQPAHHQSNVYSTQSMYGGLTSAASFGLMMPHCAAGGGGGGSSQNSSILQLHGGGGVVGGVGGGGAGCGGSAAGGACGSSDASSHHKSMWAINPLYASNSVLSDTDSAYRTRSLPAWGKGNKQRPVSTTDDLEELYAKVNFSKKRKNRMRNDEAAIIALCRSRSQNLQGMPLEREGVVIYDERTAL